MKLFLSIAGSLLFRIIVNQQLLELKSINDYPAFYINLFSINAQYVKA